MGSSSSPATGQPWSLPEDLPPSDRTRSGAAVAVEASPSQRTAVPKHPCRGSSKMDAPKEVQPTGEFTCQLCNLTAPYTYYGQKPPHTRSIVLLEESYIMKDPFTPDKDKFLILGSHCSLCSRSVCVGTECSLFYSKRFCLPCVNENLKAFPLEIQEDMDKRKPQEKSSSKKTHTRA